MKKFAIMALIGLAAVATACSDDDDKDYRPGQKGDRITFGTMYINNNVNHRNVTTLDNLRQFSVWGFVTNPSSLVFNDATVNKSGKDWVVDQTEYWYPTQRYWFSAVAPADHRSVKFTPTTVASPDNQYNGGGTIAFNNDVADGNVDLIYAFAPDMSYSGEGEVPVVNFNFYHQLAQMRMTFMNATTNTTSLKITDIELNGIPVSGTIDLTQANPEWKLDGPQVMDEDLTLVTGGQLANNKSDITRGIMVIPTTMATTYTLEFDLEVFSAGASVARHHHMVNLPVVNMNRGEIYNYVARLTPDNVIGTQLKPIEFNVTEIADWVDAPDINIPGFNN